ncbi:MULTISPECIES: fimbria/pilus outer membrane usher protein [Enterobacter]|nr:MULTISPECIES: fimbria/pilus outer membrane usher protein [Enterobacter]
MRLPLIFMCTGLVFYSSLGFSEGYEFDASEIGSDVDVSFFNQGGQLPGMYYVDVVINGKIVDTRNVNFKVIKNVNGLSSLEPCLDAESLSRYGIKVEDYIDVPVGVDNKLNIEQCIDLYKIEKSTTKLDLGEQKLILYVPQLAMHQSVNGVAPKELWDDGITAFLMNYRASATRVLYNGEYGKIIDSKFIQLEPGGNIGPWRIRNLTSWNNSSYESGKWDSPYIYAERGLYKSNSRLTLGDRYTPSDIFDSVPFRGVMLASDESMVPYDQREFSPVIRGVARTQARIEVKQNGYTIHNVTVSPGPFAISDLPLSSGSGGDLQVTVWETDGSPQDFTVTYSTPAVALREGYLKYNIMIGQYRSGESFSPGVLQTTFMYGLPWYLTTYSGIQFSENYLATSLGMGFSLGKLGALSLDGTSTRSKYKSEITDTGHMWRLRYNKLFELTNTNFSLASYKSYSLGYHSLSDVINSYSSPSMYRNDNQSKSASNLSLNQSFGSLGGLNINASRSDYWNNSGYNYSFGLGYGVMLKGASLSLNWTKNLRHEQDGNTYSDSVTSLWMSIPLRGFLDGNVSTSYQLISPSVGDVSHEVGLQGYGFEKKLSWDVRQRYLTSMSDSNNSSIRMTVHGNYGDIGGNYSYTPNVRQIGANFSGGVIVHGNGITLSQALSDTTALIDARGVSGVRVYSGNNRETDFRGFTTATYLNPFNENIISLDPDYIPQDSEITQTDKKVVPTKGAVVAAKFNVRKGGRALMRITKVSGDNIPFGSLVLLNKQNASAGVVGDNGEAYLTGLPETGFLLVKWGDDSEQQCQVKYELPKKKNNAGIYIINGVCQ